MKSQRIHNMFLVTIGAMLLLLGVAACTMDVQQMAALQAENATLKEQNQALKELVAPPPDSLDNYFPPKAPAPIYLFEMFNLAEPFQGIIVDLQEQDTAGVQANYEAFKAQYNKVAKMVPEWKDHFPAEPVEALGQALTSGDPSQVGPALAQVDAVCGACHLRFQIAVQQKYHWGDFSTVTLTDPVTSEEVTWEEYMIRMAGTFSGIGNDLRQGQVEQARQYFDAFSARFKALPEGCKTCHSTPGASFVDEGMQAMVGQLGEALATDPPNGEAIGRLLGGIGNESCLKCHMVHFPATYAKERWERFAELFK